MPDYTPKSSGQSFAGSLMKHIQSRLPYQGNMLIQNLEEINPKYRDFYKAGTYRQELLAKHSISGSTPDEFNTPIGVGIDKNYLQYLYANIDSDKSKRLREYRIMAAFSEVADALDEICDEAITKDENDRIVTLSIKKEGKKEYNDNIVRELDGEFQRLMQYFDFENKGWEYFRSLLIEGELVFENIIHKDHKDAGILGVLNIPSEIIDPIYDNVQNFIIKGFLLRKPEIVENKNARNSPVNTKVELIPMDRNQVTYIHSGLWNDDKTMRLPYLENARRAYRQLSLIEDSIVIYRLVRAPERLVFNVDVGNMPAPKAESYLKKLMNQYWQKKSFDAGQNQMVNTFNPLSMLDNFWFAKRAGSEGTTVDQLAGGQNLGELEDLTYFLKKLYKSLRVPTNRVDPESRFTDGADILREELKFAKFIIRLQQSVACALKNTFITHLKLRGLWDTYSLKEHHICVEFNPPSNFYELREQQKFELKANNFNSMTSNQLISTSHAQKKYLGWTDTDIQTNREWLKKDAALRWELSQIESAGPNWREVYKPGEQGGMPGEEGMPPGGGGGGPMGGGSALGGMPPEFGPAPEGGEEMPGGEQPAGGAPQPGAAPEGQGPVGAKPEPTLGKQPVGEPYKPGKRNK